MELLELDDASVPEELLELVVDFSEPLPMEPRFVPAEPPNGLVVELLPVSPGLLKADPLELLPGFDPNSNGIPSLDPGLLLLVPLEPLDPPELAIPDLLG